MRPLEPITRIDIDRARDRIAGLAIRTPLIRLAVDDAPADIYLKLENLQPIGSFKIRGAANALAHVPRHELADGVYTASAGNWAQGVAWNARRLGIPARILVPDHAPRTKRDAILRLGGEVMPLPFDEWWQAMVTHGRPGVAGRFMHPVSDPAVIAGNATIGMEILEDRPDVEAIIVPFGGGGLSCGIASAVRAAGAATKVYAAEVATAAPLAASLATGIPTTVDYTASFVDGIGGRSVLSEMWSLARSLLAGSLVVPLAAVAAAVRLLAERNRVIAEGAGAASVAAALHHPVDARTIVCVVSGGNIDAPVLTRILNGETP